MLRNQLLDKISLLDMEMKKLLEKLKPYSFDELNKKPNPETWSPIQVLHHLIISEKLSLAYCQKKLSFEPVLKKANLRTWFNGRLVSWALISPFKFKAPEQVKAEKFQDSDTLENVLNQWTEARKDLLEFIETIPDKYIDKEVYKHPFQVRLSLSGMLDFYKNHFKRHRKQIFSRLP